MHILMNINFYAGLAIKSSPAREYEYLYSWDFVVLVVDAGNYI